MTATGTIGVILAGGQSRRMGQDKASLPFQGARLIDHVAATLIEAGCDRVIVSGQVAGYVSVADLRPSQGPVGGICSCLLSKTLPEQARIIFCPVDLPRLTPAPITRLLTAVLKDQACQFDLGPLPFALRLTPDLPALAQRQLAAPELSVKAFLRRLLPLILPTTADEAHALTGTNTPTDWNEAISCN